MLKIKKNLAYFTLLVVVFALFCGFFKNVNFVNAEEIKTSARGMCTIETTSNRVLYSKNMHEKMPMASTTKIITAISVLSKIEDLDQKALIPKAAIKIPGSSLYLEEGESLTIRELLYGLMLRSGNDAAVALAILAFGSVQEFLDYTNEFVKTIGANNTHLANPHGLDNERHFTTPYDLAIITSFALKNEKFAEIVSSQEYVIDKNLDKDGHKRLLKNKNKFLKNYEYADGVKTGYTSKAGRSFVGSATKDGMQVVCVVLNCKPMFEECERLITQAFREYRMAEILNPEVRGTIEVVAAKQKSKLNVVNKSRFLYPVKDGEIEQISITSNFVKKIDAPVDKDFVVGQISVNLGKHLIFTDKIYTINSVNKDNIMNNVNGLLRDFIGR